MGDLSEEFENLLSAANRKALVRNQKELAHSRFLVNSSYSFGGGTFTITPELMMYVDRLIDNGEVHGTLIDDHNEPIQITDLAEFSRVIKSKYKEAVNEYLFNVEKIRRSRTSNELVE